MNLASRFNSALEPRWLVWARPAWLVYTVIVFAINLWLIPFRLNQSTTIGWPEWSQAESLKALAELGIAPVVLAGVTHWINVLTPFLYLGLASIVFWKKSSDRTGLWWALVFVAFWSPFADLGKIYPAWIRVGELHDALSVSLFFAALYSFPDGRFKPGWTRWAALAMAATQIWRLFQPEVYGRVFPAFAVVSFVSIPVAQIFRYLRLSDPGQRQQIKWVVFGLAVCTLPLVVFLLAYVSTPALQQPTAAGMAAFLIGDFLWLAFAWTLPVSFVIAIVRSGLWDIDLVIRRTLVYTLLTLLLGLVYFGGVTLLQSLFAGVSGQSSPAALVISTLLIAALFTPLRRTIQDFIDRRFYRRKYDAERALAQFAAVARSETDLAALTSKLASLVSETVQPEKVGLWLKSGHRSSPVDDSVWSQSRYSAAAQPEKP